MPQQNISILLAVAENGVIGRSGAILPWHLRGDLQRFKALTTDQTVIMGRKTFDSIGRALPRRHNIVVSRQHNLAPAGCTVVGSLEQALAAAGAGDVFVIGGRQIFELALPQAARLFLTRVHARPIGDVTVSLDLTDWHETWRESHAADAHNDYDYTFINLERLLNE